jgi:trk system potassium uptake protein TrkA
VFVLAATERAARARALRNPDRPVRRMMIAGGGKVGLRLARSSRASAGEDHRANRKRCDYLATELPSDVLVLQGDGTDEELLGDENVQDMDLFLAAHQRRRGQHHGLPAGQALGARRVLALINRRAYADLVQGTQIDIAMSPAHAVIGELLATCGAATWRPCTACAAARPRRWRRGARRPQDLPHGRPAHRADRPAGGARIGAIVRGLHRADGSPGRTAGRAPQVIMRTTTR